MGPFDGVAAPLRHTVFRRIWLASLLSNLGLLIQGVGAAWAMTQMISSADKVALVQTALMLPVMLISMPAGAIADMYDRRIVALVSLSIALVGATTLSVLAWLGLVTPEILLAFCFVVGSGMALFGPAWQSSVSEQVPAETLPSAVALNGISYNIARSFGPAIGGIVVATAGAVAAFAINAVLYIPLLVVLFLWRRTSEPSRLPRERLNRAIVSGVRYIANSPSIRIVLARTLVTGLIGGSVSALMPLVARDLLDGGAQTYGIMLGAFGMGAVIGALNIGEVRKRMSGEAAVRGCTLTMAGAIAAVALSRQPVDRGGAGGCRRGVDAGGRLVQHRRAAVRAALGGGPLAGGIPGFHCRRHRDRKLGLGTSDGRGRRRNGAIGFCGPDVCFAVAWAVAEDAAGRRPH
jgi:MFS family permease